MSILEESIGTARVKDPPNIKYPLPKHIAVRGGLTQKLPFPDDLRTHAQSPCLNQQSRVTISENVQETRCEDCSSNTNLILQKKSQPTIETRKQPPTSKQLIQPKRFGADHISFELLCGVPKRAPPLQSSLWQTSNSSSHGRYLRQSPAFRDNPSPQSEAQKFLDSLPPSHFLSPTNTPSTLPLRPSQPLLPVPIASTTSLNDVHVLRFSLIGLTYETLLSALSRLFAHQVTSVWGSASRWELRYANIESVKFTSQPTSFDERPETVVVGPRNVCDAVRMVGESRGELKLIVQIEDIRMEKGWIIEKARLVWDDYDDYEVGSWWGNLKRARRESGQDRER
ncbi:MAG: hypothetical protein Q9214_007103 [Letrouitia sp. 1 TL-2023]